MKTETGVSPPPHQSKVISLDRLLVTVSQLTQTILIHHGLTTELNTVNIIKSNNECDRYDVHTKPNLDNPMVGRCSPKTKKDYNRRNKGN